MQGWTDPPPERREISGKPVPIVTSKQWSLLSKSYKNNQHATKAKSIINMYLIMIEIYSKINTVFDEKCENNSIP